jgi:hypothetical protein
MLHTDARPACGGGEHSGALLTVCILMRDLHAAVARQRRRVLRLFVRGVAVEELAEAPAVREGGAPPRAKGRADGGLETCEHAHPISADLGGADRSLQTLWRSCGLQTERVREDSSALRTLAAESAAESAEPGFVAASAASCNPSFTWLPNPPQSPSVLRTFPHI